MTFGQKKLSFALLQRLATHFDYNFVSTIHMESEIRIIRIESPEKWLRWLQLSTYEGTFLQINNIFKFNLACKIYLAIRIK